MTSDFKNFEQFVPKRSSDVQDSLNAYGMQVGDWVSKTDSELSAFQAKADENFNSLQSQVSETLK